MDLYTFSVKIQDKFIKDVNETLEDLKVDKYEGKTPRQTQIQCIPK